MDQHTSQKDSLGTSNEKTVFLGGYEKAGIWIRVWATIIDIIISINILWLLFLPIKLFFFLIWDKVPDISASILPVYIIWYLFYFITPLCAYGWTPGKKIFGLRVVRRRYNYCIIQLPVLVVAIREIIFKPLTILSSFIGVFITFSDEDKRTLHDLFIHTLVLRGVRGELRVKADQIVLTPSNKLGKYLDSLSIVIPGTVMLVLLLGLQLFLVDPFLEMPRNKFKDLLTKCIAYRSEVKKKPPTFPVEERKDWSSGMKAEVQKVEKKKPPKKIGPNRKFVWRAKPESSYVYRPPKEEKSKPQIKVKKEEKSKPQIKVKKVVKPVPKPPTGGLDEGIFDKELLKNDLFRNGVELIKEKNYVDAIIYIGATFPKKDPQSCIYRIEYTKYFFRYGKRKFARRLIRKIRDSTTCQDYIVLSENIIEQLMTD